MDIELEIFRVDFIQQSCWFLQVELEQQVFPSKEKFKQKQRTDLKVSSSPSFSRNIFVFHDVSLSNRISLKLGAVEVPSKSSLDSSQISETKLNPSDCICQGVYTLVLTQRIISSLRDSVPFLESLHLKHPLTSSETCTVKLSLSFRIYGTEELIIQNERELRKIEFEVYEQNPTVIQDKLNKVIELCAKKAKELEDWITKTDSMKNALRSITTDFAMLEKQKMQLETMNDAYRRELERLRNLEDIHIQIDLLMTSEQGVIILKQKLEKLLYRYNLEQQRYQTLTSQWLDIEAKQRGSELLKQKLQEVRDANSQAMFHIKRYSEMLPEVLVLRDQVRSYNSMISSLESDLKSTKIENNPLISIQLEKLRYNKSILNEKYKQLQLSLSDNKGLLHLSDLQSLNLDEKFSENELQSLQSRSKLLLQEVQNLSSELTKEQVSSASLSNSNILSLEVQLDSLKIRMEVLSKEMESQAILQGKEVAGLRYELSKLQALEQEEL